MMIIILKSVRTIPKSKNVCLKLKTKQQQYKSTNVLSVLLKHFLKCILFYKIGKGTYRWKSNGAIYDGDWKKGKRSGFGTFSLPDGKGGYKKGYSGGWKNDMRHVCIFPSLIFKLHANKVIFCIFAVHYSHTFVNISYFRFNN